MEDGAAAGLVGCADEDVCRSTLFGHAAAALILFGVRTRTSRGRQPFGGTPWERATWTMPPIESLTPPAQSLARTLGLIILRIDLIGAAALLAVRAAEILLAA